MDLDFTLPLNGTKLHFRVRGKREKNPFLLLLHGGPGFSSHMFAPWGETLENRCTVIYLDQRGCGQSERLTPETSKNFTVANLLKDIEAVRGHLKLENWFVLGHSWGGMLGLEYVAQFPKVVRGYVHMDGLISQPLSQDAIFAAAKTWIERDAKSEKPEQQARGKRLAPFVDYGRTLPQGTQRLLSAMQFAMSLPELYYADLKTQATYQERISASLKQAGISPSVLYANEPGMALAQYDSYATRDARPLFPKITVPTLVLNGNQDGVIPPEHARIAAKGIRGAHLELLDRCGHFPFVEQPEKTTQAILKFIA